ncbi:hypothetical protein J6590_079114 [Homalodisca vitripennis]|nr:hypothetical protein J6590_079114 [Homalodisca vitripennis]
MLHSRKLHGSDSVATESTEPYHEAVAQLAEGERECRVKLSFIIDSNTSYDKLRTRTYPSRSFEARENFKFGLYPYTPPLVTPLYYLCIAYSGQAMNESDPPTAPCQLQVTTSQSEASVSYKRLDEVPPILERSIWSSLPPGHLCVTSHVGRSYYFISCEPQEHHVVVIISCLDKWLIPLRFCFRRVPAQLLHVLDFQSTNLPLFRLQLHCRAKNADARVCETRITQSTGNINISEHLEVITFQSHLPVIDSGLIPPLSVCLQLHLEVITVQPHLPVIDSGLIPPLSAVCNWFSTTQSKGNINISEHLEVITVKPHLPVIDSGLIPSLSAFCNWFSKHYLQEISTFQSILKLAPSSATCRLPIVGLKCCAMPQLSAVCNWFSNVSRPPQFLRRLSPERHTGGAAGGFMSNARIPWRWHTHSPWAMFTGHLNKGKHLPSDESPAPLQGEPVPEEVHSITVPGLCESDYADCVSDYAIGYVLKWNYAFCITQ